MQDSNHEAGSNTQVMNAAATENKLMFECSICEEPSTRICVYCTKDACENHLCPKCDRCSDCCDCELRTPGRSANDTLN
jgi:hypothetical protein